MQCAECRILRVNDFGSEYYQLILERPETMEFGPGQFVQVKDAQSPDLLRRPFSVASQESGTFSLLIKEVGSMTRRLRRSLPGQPLDVIGPLGRPFEPSAGKSPLLIGGGVGIAPLLRLSQVLGERGTDYICLLGFRDECRPAELFDPLHLRVHRESTDGGFVTDLLKESVRPDTEIFACGPLPMLRIVHRLARESGVPAQLSLEERMACGLGACIGCAVEVRTGGGNIYKKVCTDGPVFRGEELPW